MLPRRLRSNVEFAATKKGMHHESARQRGSQRNTIQAEILRLPPMPAATLPSEAMFDWPSPSRV